MRRLSLLLVAAALWFSAGTTPLSGQQVRRAETVHNEVLVKFRAGAADARRDAVVSGIGGKRLKRFRQLDIDHVQLPDGRPPDDAIAELLAAGDVVAAQPNYRRQIALPTPPNDFFWVNDADWSFWGIPKIEAHQVWNTYTTGNSAVIIADIDTGVKYTHPDLQPNMWINTGELPGNGLDDDGNGYVDDVHGINVVTSNPSQRGNPMDDHGHGTHTAGTFAAVGNNGPEATTGKALVGVTWNSKILACKFLNAQGSGTDAGAIECFNYITMMKNRGFNIRVSNNSWGGYRDLSGPFPQLLKDAIDAAGNAGIINIFAAGNGGADGIGDNIDVLPHDPASFTSPSIVSVAASDINDGRAAFSNYGAASVDVAAPGVNVLSAWIGSRLDCVSSGGNSQCAYKYLNGTSMATPHVAGAAALLVAQSGSLPVSKIKQFLLEGAAPVPAWTGLIATGARLNVFNAAGAVAAYEDAITQAVIGGGARLQQLQNGDGGWYFSAADTHCGAGAGVSCSNIIGVTGLGLLSAYDRSRDPATLADAVAAGRLMQARHDANPTQQPFSQDLEFLTALSAATGDPQYAALAAAWFTTITLAHPLPADRVDFAFNRRHLQGLRTLAVWDVASTIRAAKAAGNVSYASGLAARVVARAADWKDLDVAHRWDQCEAATGCGHADNPLAFDYTLLGMGSMLWAMHDLPGFTAKIAEYRSWLLSQQDAAGSWDVGDVQITSYAAMGLGAVGGAGATDAIARAVDFFMANRLPNGGWPFSVTASGVGPEFTNVNAEVVRAIATLSNTQPGQGVTVTPAQLATVTFSDVRFAGSTTVVAQPAGGQVPAGYSIVPGLVYTVDTTAAVTGPSTVCFNAALTRGLSNVRILHREGQTFVDRTTADHCAEAGSLSTFAISRLDDAADVEPPLLSVGLSPAVLSPPNNKMIAVTAAISAADNSGLPPAVTLVSITASGAARGKKELIAGAEIGADDRAFELRAQKGRVYTIVYRATDASGNSSEVSRQIAVP
jgi:subtilisin family serine protease